VSERKASKRLKVTLVHGAVEDASYPVVVGHYQGTPVAGGGGGGRPRGGGGGGGNRRRRGGVGQR
jgi:hypothetical protein